MAFTPTARLFFAAQDTESSPVFLDQTVLVCYYAVPAVVAEDNFAAAVKNLKVKIFLKNNRLYDIIHNIRYKRHIGGGTKLEKEQLTIYQIKKDLMQYLYKNTFAVIFGFPIFWLVLAIGNIMLKHIFSVKILSLGSLTLIMLFCEITVLFYNCFLYIRVKKLKFKIRTDKVIEKRAFRQGLAEWSSYRPYRLYFTLGHFDIYPKSYYKWSSMYSMSEKEIYDSTCIGDTFTIVEINKTVLVAYNNKFFHAILSNTYFR